MRRLSWSDWQGDFLVVQLVGLVSESQVQLAGFQ